MERTQKRKITRNREFRACTECRKRKLKCNRQLPCASCIQRNEATSCVYVKNLDRPQRENKDRVRDGTILGHLEQSVEDLPLSREIYVGDGKLPLDVDTVQYGKNGIHSDDLHRGATHWSTVLEDIEELRAAVKEQGDINGHGVDLDSDNIDATSILFGSSNTLSFQRVLLRYLPPREKSDRLVGAYFRMKAVAAPFIHSTQFLRLYQIFWGQPSAASPLWTSILFSILHIATRTGAPGSSTNECDGRMRDRFDMAAAHCLASGGYCRPQRFGVEALLLYAQSRCLTSVDIGSDVAILFGTLVRLAVTMGYHRDADRSPQKLTAFEGEMRRRTWSLCMQLDMLVSFQHGLPSNTQYPTWDTKPPTNLLDSDFDEDTVHLPLARPVTEPNELLFYIAKHSLMSVFEKIIRHTLSAFERPNNELELLDQEIRGTFAALPAVFHPRPMTESIVDSPSVKVTRLCVYFIYQKCLCVLHRKYVTLGREKSLRTCYTSASDLLRQFLDMYKEFEPGGQLETERWFMGSITWHDFLLGSMVLCLILCSTMDYNNKAASATIVDIAESLDLLKKAKGVCKERSAKSKDTKKVQRLIEATVTKFGISTSGSESAAHVSSRNGEVQPSQAQWYGMSSDKGYSDWLQSESMMDSASYTGWAYLEHFLDLSDEDFMADT